MTKIDFVVVAFEGEFGALLLQVRSLARSNAGEFINRYIIIWNEAPLSAEKRHVTIERIASEFQGSKIAWGFIERNFFAPEAIYGSDNGNRTQQALKLEAARVVRTDAYCILDAKNAVIRDLALSDFVTASGRMRGHHESLGKGHFYHHLLGGLKYFGANDAEIKNAFQNPTLQTTTPYVMSTAICLNLISVVEHKEGMSFSEAFMDVEDIKKCNEFYLYFAFLVKKHGSFEPFYELDVRIYSTFFRRSPFGEKLISEALQGLSESNIKFLGLHRHRRTSLTDSEKQAFVSYWCGANLFPSASEAYAYIERGELNRPLE